MSSQPPLFLSLLCLLLLSATAVAAPGPIASPFSPDYVDGLDSHDPDVEFVPVEAAPLPGQYRPKLFTPSKDELSRLPEAVDWVAKEAVGRPESQGMCDSCYCFAAAAAAEGAMAIDGGGLTALSTQQMLDCAQQSESREYSGNWHCNTGQIDRAMAYAVLHGLASDSQYPYENQRGSAEHPCRADGAAVVYKAPGILRVRPRSEEDMMAAVARGPVAAGVNADAAVYIRYKGGVIPYDEKDIGRHNNHAVAVVGYGVDADTQTKYWLVKNSRGGSWGEDGFFRLERGRGNTLGILSTGFFFEKGSAPPMVV